MATAIDPKVRQLRARAGGYTRRGNLEAAEETRRELEAYRSPQRVAHAVAVVAAAPEGDLLAAIGPPDSATARRLVALLSPHTGEDTDRGAAGDDVA